MISMMDSCLFLAQYCLTVHRPQASNFNFSAFSLACADFSRSSECFDYTARDEIFSHHRHHPFIIFLPLICCVAGRSIQGDNVQNLDLIGYLLQLFWEDTKVFPSKLTDIICQAYPGSRVCYIVSEGSAVTVYLLHRLLTEV